uniref:Uncharacterized protein n=1 Tax=viral metagenome TaxID=1070528 RepID=A0A6C0JX78_9ZZZZ
MVDRNVLYIGAGLLLLLVAGFGVWFVMNTTPSDKIGPSPKGSSFFSGVQSSVANFGNSVYNAFPHSSNIGTFSDSHLNGDANVGGRFSPCPWMCVRKNGICVNRLTGAGCNPPVAFCQPPCTSVNGVCMHNGIPCGINN